MNRTVYFIVLPFFILAFGYWLLSIQGFWPAALVNGRPIFLRDWEENVRASKQFYSAQNIQSQLSKINFEGEESEKNIEKIRSQILNAMIEDKILHFEYKKSGGAELEKKVAERLSSVFENRNQSNLNQGIALLYGWDLSEFKNRILEPRALREILEEDSQKDHRDFDEFLKTVKQGASVFIFLTDFKWDKDKLEVVKR
ncbi:MAG: SurA N-terminal domain-containing protein [Parcubacteria group bacterium]|nr:SurA N-terminal domain-containing protein [Parcubacteria group bacterium]